MASSVILMMIRRSDLLALMMILCFGFGVGSVSAAPCYNYSWIEVPSAGILNPFQDSVVRNASECQRRCIDDNRCYGVTWNRTTTNDFMCYFNFATNNATNSGITYFRPDTSNTYYSLLRDTPSCSYQDNNCSYMWKGQKDVHGFSGVDGNRNNLNDCVRLCQATSNCTGVDWNQQDVACWLNTNSPVITGNQPNITFFVKNCNDSPPTTTKATTPGPSTTSTSTTTTTTTTTTPTTTPTTTTPTTTTPTTTTPTTTPTTTTPTTTTTTTLPTTSTSTMATTTTTAPTTTRNTSKNNEGPSGMAMMQGEFAHYPQAIKPAYIVLAGLGGGCILLVITAIVILCLYPLHRNSKYSTNSTVTAVQTTHQPYVEDNSYVDSQEPERIDMGEMAEGEVKTYYNAEETD